MFKIANVGMFKRALASVACAAVIVSGTATMAFAKDAGVTYNFDEKTGTLTISGTGAMDSYGPEGKAPWSVDGYKIKNVVIEDGVTTIGDYAFAGLDNLLSVVVPESITTIGEGAFSGCYALDNFGYGNNKYESAVIKANVRYVGKDAFFGCSKMGDIYLESTDLTGYHFDTLDSVVEFRYDFRNFRDTKIHVAKGFGDHITLDQCEALYQWQRAAGDVNPIVADLEVAGTIKGDRKQQADAAKAAASEKSAAAAAEAGLKATSAAAREVAAAQAAAEGKAAAEAAEQAAKVKAATTAKVEAEAATAGQIAAEADAAKAAAAAQAAADGKAAAEAAEQAAKAKAATTAKVEAEAAAAGEHAAEIKAISESNRRYHASCADTDHRHDEAVKRCGEATRKNDAERTAKKFEEQFATSGDKDDAPMKRDNDRPGRD